MFPSNFPAGTIQDCNIVRDVMFENNCLGQQLSLIFIKQTHEVRIKRTIANKDK